MALSHDDRHYRPDNRHNSNSARRYEGNGDSDGRQIRHHSGTTGRSPERGPDCSRSLSPQGRDHVHSNQRRSNKLNEPQKEKENTASDAPKNDNRLSSPPSTTQHLSRSMRRQMNRAQNQKDDRARDTQAEEAPHVIQHKEASSKGHNDDRTYPSDHTNTTNSTLSTLLPLFLRINGTDTCVVIPGAIFSPHCLACFALLTLGHSIGVFAPRTSILPDPLRQFCIRF